MPLKVIQNVKNRKKLNKETDILGYKINFLKHCYSFHTNCVFQYHATVITVETDVTLVTKCPTKIIVKLKKIIDFTYLFTTRGLNVLLQIYI